MIIPLSMLAAHFIGDFLLQTDWMATNKSKNWAALFLHCFVYSFCFFAWGPMFVVLTFCFHVITDAITSRITSKLWFFTPINAFYNVGKERYQLCIPRGGSRHWFFVVIGLDQLIHFVTLSWTLQLLG